MTELLSSFDLFCNSIVDILLKSDDRNFLSLKLLLMYNNVCSIPFENINAYMSLFYDKLKYQLIKILDILYIQILYMYVFFSHIQTKKLVNRYLASC